MWGFSGGILGGQKLEKDGFLKKIFLKKKKRIFFVWGGNVLSPWVTPKWVGGGGGGLKGGGFFFPFLKSQNTLVFAQIRKKNLVFLGFFFFFLKNGGYTINK